MSSIISNRLYFLNQDKFIFVAFKREDKVNISFRGKDALKITLEAIKDFEGATGGGHEVATGAMVSNLDFEKFKEILQQTKQKFGYRIHHYCLMNTHFHLLVSMAHVEQFSKGMKELKRLYANWAHKEQKRYGPIWWGRFGSQVIEDERYLYACGLYIEMNPVKAGLVLTPEEWEYSSSRHYFLGTKDSLIDDYERPSREAIRDIEGNLNLERGHVIGSDLFKIYEEENV